MCDDVRLSSSSGGVFTVLAENVLRRGGIVVGCAMTADCYAAEHVVVNDTQMLSVFRGAKYVQSRADQVFPTVREALKSGKYVLFSGTPCQVAGLRSYISGMDEERLITVDLVCHGAPSPLVWERYVKHWESEKGSKVVSVHFRDKQQGWEKYSLVLQFENGEEYRSLCSKDLYCKGFVSDYFLRRSCYHCHAKGERHASDITLGDFWGINHISEDMNDGKGTSLVLVNSEKGERFFQDIQDQLVWKSVNEQSALQYNPSYSHSSDRLVYRHYFMRSIQRRSICKQLKAYCGTSIFHRMKRKMIRTLGRFSNY
jgi:coenzyme F420-reducing hydrogenase beta subunit